MKARAQLMQNASENIPSGMLTVFCDHKTELKKALRFAREYCIKELKMENPICSIANYLCTDAKVIAGHEEVRQIIKFCRLLMILTVWAQIRTNRMLALIWIQIV